MNFMRKFQGRVRATGARIALAGWCVLTCAHRPRAHAGMGF